MSRKVTNLEELQFDNRFVNELPADEEERNFTRQVWKASYSFVKPTPVNNPHLISSSKEMLEELEIDEKVASSKEFVEVFSGNHLLKGMQPFAMNYAGHQFGNFAGQLGDGRAINLGEVKTSTGKHWTLQLKGAGLTPYSRTADGLAVLRSSIREYLCSEAMHYLGVPTTRALSLVGTGEKVLRDMFYDGNPEYEPGAIVCRVSPSFIRFGNFQIYLAQQNIELLEKFLHFTITNDFPHLGEPNKETYLEWFDEVCKKTAELIVHWKRVGFVHGVMNTDNMSILGLTIDYGPYGWVDNYDPDWTPNTTDAQGRRYRFGAQADIGLWNLYQLAQTLTPFFEDTEPLEKILNSYSSYFTNRYQIMMSSKLGLQYEEGLELEDLIDEVKVLLQLAETDMTIFFRELAKFDHSAKTTTLEDILSLLKPSFYDASAITEEYKERLQSWFFKYDNILKRQGLTPKEKLEKMNAVNPKYIFRNYIAQEAIDLAEKGDFSRVNQLLEIFKHPYDEQATFEKFYAKRPEWAKVKAGCSMLSCSS